MQKIIVLDFETGSIHIFDYDSNVWEDCLEFLESEEVKKFIPNGSSNTQYMVVDRMNIEIH